VDGGLKFFNEKLCRDILSEMGFMSDENEID
jgi:hypothetical protein